MNASPQWCTVDPPAAVRCPRGPHRLRRALGVRSDDSTRTDPDRPRAPSLRAGVESADVPRMTLCFGPYDHVCAQSGADVGGCAAMTCSRRTVRASESGSRTWSPASRVATSNRRVRSPSAHAASLGQSCALLVRRDTLASDLRSSPFIPQSEHRELRDEDVVVAGERRSDRPAATPSIATRPTSRSRDQRFGAQVRGVWVRALESRCAWWIYAFVILPP